MRGGGGGSRRRGACERPAARMTGGSAFRGAQASIGAGRAGPVQQWPNCQQRQLRGPHGGQFTQGGVRVDRDRDRRFGRGFGFAAGLAAGSALGYGYYDPYYYDDYAYDDYYDPGYVVSSAVDPAYCAQRYRSYDPASGTYLGYDGLRHPCGQ